MPNIEEIIKSEEQTRLNIKMLSDEYTKETGRSVCRSCPSDLLKVVGYFKTKFNMSNFEFKRERAQYKLSKKDSLRISNSNLTDELAIKFLKSGNTEERAKLFSKMPKNWKELIGNNKDEKRKQTELDAKKKEEEAAKEAEELEKKKQAELKTKEDSEEVKDEEKKEESKNKDSEDVLDSEDDKSEDCCDDDKEEPCEDCQKKKREELESKTLKELRKAYPEIKAVAKDDFINKIFEKE